MRNLMIGLASVVFALVFSRAIDSSRFAGVFQQSIGATQDLAAIRLPRTGLAAIRLPRVDAFEFV